MTTYTSLTGQKVGTHANVNLAISGNCIDGKKGEGGGGGGGGGGGVGCGGQRHKLKFYLLNQEDLLSTPAVRISLSRILANKKGKINNYDGSFYSTEM